MQGCVNARGAIAQDRQIQKVFTRKNLREYGGGQSWPKILDGYPADIFDAHFGGYRHHRTLAEIKRELLTNAVAVADAFHVYDDFVGGNGDAYRSSTANTRREKPLGLHAMVIMGLEDDQWLVRNTW